MASAPQFVKHAVGRTPVLACLLSGVWLVGALAGVLGWALSAGATGGLQVLLGLAWLLGVGLAFGHFWRSQWQRCLHWDGAQWQLQELSEPEGTVVRVRVRLDLQFALLLRCQGRSGQAVPRWLWVQRGSDAANWHLLRCALYFNALDDTQAAPA